MTSVDALSNACDDPDAERAAAGRVEADVVALVGAVDDQQVLAGAAAAVGDLDPRLVARRDRDHVVLGELVGRVAGGVERDAALPRRDRALAAVDLDAVVGVRDDERVVARAAGQDRLLEAPAEVLDDRARVAVAAAGDAEVRVLLGADPLDQLVLERQLAVAREELRAGVAEQRADDEGVVVEAHVAVLRLDERVDVGAAGGARDAAVVLEDVEARAAGDGVRAAAGVDDVVERRADQTVVAEPADELDLDQVGMRRRRVRDQVADRRGVDRVVAVLAGDRQAVVLGALRLCDPEVGALRVDHAHDRVGAVCGLVLGERERVVGAVGARERDHVGRTVVGDVDARAADGLRRLGAGAVVVLDHGVERARVGEDLAGVDADALDRVALEARDGEPVGACAEVDHELLDVERDEVAGRRRVRDEDRRRGRRRDRDVVVACAGRDQEDVLRAAAGQHVVGEAEGRHRDPDQVVAGARVERVLAAAAVELVVAVAATQQVAGGAAEQAVVAVAAEDLGARRAVVHDEVGLGAALELDETGGERAGLDVVVARVAEQLRVAAALVDQRVVAAAAVEHDVGEHAPADDDRVVAAVGERVDVPDPLVDLLAAADDDADRLVVARPADVLDHERLVGQLVAEVAAGEYALDLVGALAHVEVEVSARGPAGAALRLRVRAGVAREVDDRRQLDRADLERHGLRDLDEQDLEADGNPRDQVLLAGADGRRRGGEADAGERDAEEARVDVRRELDVEAVGHHVLALDRRRVRVVAAVRRVAGLGQADHEREVADEAERARPEHQLGGQPQGEEAARVDPAADVHRREAEEVGARAEVDRPVARAEDERVGGSVRRAADGQRAAADLDHERGVELDDLDELDLAGQRELERLAADDDAAEVAIRVAGVQAQLAGRLDLHQVEHVDVERDGQPQREARVVVRVDAGAARGRDGDRSEHDLDAERDLDLLRVDDDVDLAVGLGEAQELDRAVDVDPQARHDLAAVEREVAPGRVDRELRGDVELQPDAGAERGVASDADAQVERQRGDEAFLADMEAAGDLDTAERADRHRRVDLDGQRDRARRELQLELALDLDDPADLELALDDDVEAILDDDTAVHDGAVRVVSVGEHEPALRVDHELARARRRVEIRLGEERDHVGVGAGRVDLDEHVARDLDARDRAAGVEVQRDASDDRRDRVGAELDVDAAGGRADERDLGADGADDPDGRAVGPDGRGERDQARQREDVLDDERALDQRVEVDLAGSRRVLLAASVRRRPRLEDRELRREVVRQHLEERLRHHEDLLAFERVEHHLDAATEAEDARDVPDRAAVVARLLGPALADADLDAEVAGDLRDDAGADLGEQQPGRAAADAERRDRAPAGGEELEPERVVLGLGDLEDEAAVEVQPLGLVLLVDRARVVDGQSADDLDRERLRGQLVRAVLAAHDDDLRAVLGDRLLDEEEAPVAVLDPPLLAGADALDRRVGELERREALELELLAAVERDLERRVGAVRHAVGVAVGGRAEGALEQIDPGRRQRDRVELVARQLGQQRVVAGQRLGEDDAARDALERQHLVLDAVGRVDLEQRGALQEDPVLLEEVEVRRERGDAPEREVAEPVALLEHERRRRRGDVADGDQLQRAGGEQADPQRVGVVRRRADLERDLAADLDDRLAVERAREAQLHAAGDVDEEDPRRRVALGRRLDRLDGLEALGLVGALVAVEVGPLAGAEADADRAGRVAAGEVVADRTAVGEDRRRVAAQRQAVRARAVELDLVAVDRLRVERDAAEQVEADVDVAAVGERRRRVGQRDRGRLAVRDGPRARVEDELQHVAELGAGDGVGPEAGRRLDRRADGDARDRELGVALVGDAGGVGRRAGAEQDVDEQRVVGVARVRVVDGHLRRRRRHGVAGLVERRDRAGQQRQRHGAGALRAVREVAEREVRAGRADEHGRLRGVELERLPRPESADRELVREVGDRRLVDRLGPGRDRVRDVDVAAAVEILDGDDAARRRVGQVGRQRGDREALGLLQADDAARRDRAALERDLDEARRERAGDVEAVDVGGAEPRRGRADDLRDAVGAGARESQLGGAVGRPGGVDRVARRRRHRHVEVVQVRRCDAVDGEVDRGA